MIKQTWKKLAMLGATTALVAVSGCAADSGGQSGEELPTSQASANPVGEVARLAANDELVEKGDCSFGGQVSVHCQGSFSNCTGEGGVNVKCGW